MAQAAVLPASATQTRRIESVDVLRGLVMVLMVLDHTRDFFSSAQGDPTNPETSWPALFFARWVTHLCAPTFVLLAGAGSAFQVARGNSRALVSRLLITRGLWLIVIEWTAVAFSLTFHYVLLLQVIWVIGLSMLLLAGLIWMPVRWLAVLSLAVIAGHDLLDGVRFHGWVAQDAWMALHGSGLLLWHGEQVAFLLYPLAPWFAVLSLGYCAGIWLAAHREVARRYGVMVGAGMLLLFTALRLLHAYGDPIPWHRYGNASQTLMAFLQLKKNPPSLEYTLATLGVSLLLWVGLDALAAWGKMSGLRGFLRVYGSVPFFFYVLHLYLVHVMTVAGTALLGLNWHWYLAAPPNGSVFAGTPPGWGFSLPVVYAMWALAVLLLYWPCRWFSEVKARRHDWWLSYL